MAAATQVVAVVTRMAVQAVTVQAGAVIKMVIDVTIKNSNEPRTKADTEGCVVTWFFYPFVHIFENSID